MQIFNFSVTLGISNIKLKKSVKSSIFQIVMQTLVLFSLKTVFGALKILHWGFNMHWI